MHSVKLVRSLVLGENINDPFLLNQTPHYHPQANDHDDDDDIKEENYHHHHYHACLLFIPTHELIQDTYKLAVIARGMGMDFIPNPSLTNILFSCPSSSSSSSTTIIPLPFPSLSSASISHLRRFARFAKGLFKIVTVQTNLHRPSSHALSLFSFLNGDRVDDMETFSRILVGNGWALFKTHRDTDGGDLFVFRKVDSTGLRVRWWSKGVGYSGSPPCGGGSRSSYRVREVRLAPLDFRDVPLRILHYILLMTDGLFYLA